MSDWYELECHAEDACDLADATFVRIIEHEGSAAGDVEITVTPLPRRREPRATRSEWSGADG